MSGERELGPLAARAVPRIARLRYRLPASAGPNGAVALTFDDGPDPSSTPAVLDALAAAGAVATFFLVGERAAQHPGLVARMIDEGHAVGSHSWSHDHLELLTGEPLRGELERGHAAVVRAGGRGTSLFRPPRGRINTRIAVAVRRAGLRPWMWSVDTEDWRTGARSEAILGRASALDDGDVVLLHDAIADPEADPASHDRTATLTAIPQIVDAARRRGLDLVTLPA